MTEKRCLVCNCENTMAIDEARLRRALGDSVSAGHVQLCRSQIGDFEKALATGSDLVVACTQEAPLFREIAEEQDRAGDGGPLRFVNIREMAGWTADKADPTPKMAALLAGASRTPVPARIKEIESDGLCLVIGSGQAALDTAIRLNADLSVTLLLTEKEPILLPMTLDVPVYCGRITSLTGTLGAFQIVIDGYAALSPSSRDGTDFGPARDGVESRCSVVVDLTGGEPLVPHHRRRDGYFRADPANAAALADMVMEASGYTGTFEKPIYIEYDSSICAHSRSRKTGCSKCLDNCPAGAIQPDGDFVRFDTDLCGGCGNCAAHCPSGAVTYTYPPLDETMAAIQGLAAHYFAAGGKAPALLIHEAGHGGDIINALARFGSGLPAHVIPLEVFSAGSVGHVTMATALASGFCHVAVLADPSKRDEMATLYRETALLEAILNGITPDSKNDGSRVHILEESDPDLVGEALFALPKLPEIARSSFIPAGGKRELARAALGALADSAKGRDRVIDLPEDAPYGAIHVDREGCTLCMACVSACPVDAVRDTPEKPELRFVESACVQCGICAATCPEKVIMLVPRLDLSPSAMQPITLNEDEPFHCTRCDEPFATRGTIARISSQLAGQHWMYRDGKSADILSMCEDCRLETLAEDGKDPFAFAQRKRIRTTDDYIEADKRRLSIEDFLAED